MCFPAGGQCLYVACDSDPGAIRPRRAHAGGQGDPWRRNAPGFPSPKSCSWRPGVDKSRFTRDAVCRILNGGRVLERFDEPAPREVVLRLQDLVGEMRQGRPDRHGAAGSATGSPIPRTAHRRRFANIDRCCAREARRVRSNLAGPEPGGARPLAAGAIFVGCSRSQRRRSFEIEGSSTVVGPQPRDQSRGQVPG
jgi:hypothetical protein